MCPTNTCHKQAIMASEWKPIVHSIVNESKEEHTESRRKSDKRVRFVKPVVTEVRYRARTLPWDKDALFYTKQNYRQFRKDALNFRQAQHRMNRGYEKQDKVVVMKETSLFQTLVSFVKKLEEHSISTFATQENENSTDDLCYIYDFGMVASRI
mmetsp:Transcript_32829/g.48159  ORF Transcript_32829/g.48159 Transcript_32829/m.48159 type:complete len:154 (+) Transcript_32829:71-532(+)